MTRKPAFAITRRRALMVPMLPLLATSAGAAQAQDLMAAVQAQYARIEEAMQALMRIYTAPGASISTATKATLDQITAQTERMATLERELGGLREQAFAQKNQDVLRLMSDRERALATSRRQLEQAHLKWNTPGNTPRSRQLPQPG